MSFDVRVLADQAIEVWQAGGWAMYALAVNAFILFSLGVNAWFNIRATGFRKIQEKVWRRWITSPGERRGPVGELMDFVLRARRLEDLAVRFAEFRKAELAPFTRDIRLLKRAVGTAPLLGLLGTVTGMLTTFHALATGAGGDKTMDMIAKGISEALITTETGLVIALPGLFLQFHLTRQKDRYDAFLTYVETACAQHLHRERERERLAS